MYWMVQGDDHKIRDFLKLSNDLCYFFPKSLNTISGIWIFLTLFPSLLNNEDKEVKRVTTRDYIGWGMWAIGFLIESVADWQKLQFKMDPDNAVSIQVLICLCLCSQWKQCSGSRSFLIISRIINTFCTIFFCYMFTSDSYQLTCFLSRANSSILDFGQ